MKHRDRKTVLIFEALPGDPVISIESSLLIQPEHMRRILKRAIRGRTSLIKYEFGSFPVMLLDSLRKSCGSHIIIPFDLHAGLPRLALHLYPFTYHFRNPARGPALEILEMQLNDQPKVFYTGGLFRWTRAQQRWRAEDRRTARAEHEAKLNSQKRSGLARNGLPYEPPPSAIPASFKPKNEQFHKLVSAARATRELAQEVFAKPEPPARTYYEALQEKAAAEAKPRRKIRVDFSAPPIKE